MFHRFNVGNMKIDHRSRQADMTETLLYLQKAFPILQEMRSSTMPQGMYRDSVVEAGPDQGILHNDADIPGLDGLRSYPFAMCLEDEVVTGIPFLEATEHGELLLGNRHTPVFLSLALIDEDLLTVKTDINPFEAADFADSESAVIYGREQRLVI
jgi:hypothetical protein